MVSVMQHTNGNVTTGAPPTLSLTVGAMQEGSQWNILSGTIAASLLRAAFFYNDFREGG